MLSQLRLMKPAMSPWMRDRLVSSTSPKTLKSPSGQGGSFSQKGFCSLMGSGNLRHLGAHRDGIIAGLHENSQGAAGGGFHLIDGFVALKGIDGLALGYRGAVLHQPFGEGALLHRKADFGHQYVCGHAVFSGLARVERWSVQCLADRRDHLVGIG